MASLTADNGLGFSNANLKPRGRKHNEALHVSVECRGTTLAHVLVNTGSSLNVLPKKALNRLDCEGLTLKPNNIVVRAFDGSERMVHEEVDIPIKVGTQVFNSTFYVMDIRPSYSCLLGHPWIHNAGAVTSTLHKMLKYPVQGKIITVHGEEEYMISHLNSFRCVDLDGEFIETPFQHFKEVSQEVAVTKALSPIPKITRPPLRMSSLKDAKAVVEEGGCTI